MKQIAISEAKVDPSYAQVEARKLSCARLLEDHPSLRWAPASIQQTHSTGSN